MDKEKLAELLKEALDEVDDSDHGDISDGLARLTKAVNKLTKAIEAKPAPVYYYPYRYYQPYVYPYEPYRITWSTTSTSDSIGGGTYTTNDTGTSGSSLTTY